MSRVSKILSLTVLVLFLLACNLVTEPLREAQNLAETAQSVTTFIPVETLQALPSVIPAETLQALPSAIPTLEIISSAIPDFENIFNPEGTPAEEWRGIPVMPQATAGQEFGENNTYSFRAEATVKEVQEFYSQTLVSLGWEQPFSFPMENAGGLMVFQKDGSTLTVTITFSDGTAVVLLTMS